MGLGEIITRFHYKKLSGLPGFALFIGFLAPAVFYSFIIKFKNFLYKAGILKEKKVGAKVICIGNLTTGGVGKTPVTIEFAKYLSKFKKVSVLSRGYGGSLKTPSVVRNFDKILTENPEIIGDEVKLIAENADIEAFKRNENGKNGASWAVTVSKDRLKGTNLAIKTLGAEVIIMDDGFSNRKIKKDLSFLLFDVKKFIGNGFLLPLGPLREPLGEIKRAEGIILVDKENTEFETLEKLKTFIGERFQKPVFISRFTPGGFYDMQTMKTITPEGFPLFAFSAIGQPDQFYSFLTPKNLKNSELKGTLSFMDHHKYTLSDLINIVNTAKNSGAKYIVTTEKDGVKIKPLLEILPPDIKENAPNIILMKLKADLDVKNVLSSLNFSPDNIGPGNLNNISPENFDNFGPGSGEKTQ